MKGESGISLSEADLWTLIPLDLTGLDRFKEKVKKRKKGENKGSSSPAFTTSAKVKGEHTC